MDLSSLNIEELKALKRKLPGELSRRKNAVNAEELADLRSRAKKLGYKLVAVKKNTGKNAAPMYRHPQNGSLVWSGRGRRPTWVVEWQNMYGKDMSSLRI